MRNLVGSYGRQSEGYCRFGAPLRPPRTVERAAGIEPATLAWKARALPLCNARGASSLYAVETGTPTMAYAHNPRSEASTIVRKEHRRLDAEYAAVVAMEPSFAMTSGAGGLWAGLDLNQRSALARQIYSLVPLTTRPPTHALLYPTGSPGYDSGATGSSGW